MEIKSTYRKIFDNSHTHYYTFLLKYYFVVMTFVSKSTLNLKPLKYAHENYTPGDKFPTSTPRSSPDSIYSGGLNHVQTEVVVNLVSFRGVNYVISDL